MTSRPRQHGTITTVAEMDVRPGGGWRYINHMGSVDVIEGALSKEERPG